jgi:hypothetical protein
MDGLHSVSFSPTLPVLINANVCVAIHGDKQQNERDWVLNEFKTGKSPIMVATDVASRGIGMIEIPPIAMPSRLYRSALLSTLPSLSSLRNLARALSCLTVLYQRESWICGAAFLLLHS